MRTLFVVLLLAIALGVILLPSASPVAVSATQLDAITDGAGLADQGLKPTPTPTILIGDVNRDAKINSLDALWVLWFAAALFDAPLPPYPFSVAADVNEDGAINSTDALLVLQFHARLTPSLPCPEAGDVNEDGRVDSIDAALILQLDACALIEPWFCR